MAVSLDPQLRLEHLKNYVSNIHQALPFQEARVQLLRCRLVAYRLAAMVPEGWSREDVDGIFAQAYENLQEVESIVDPYLDPCSSQYDLLEWLRSLAYREVDPLLLAFIRAEFRKAIVPTLFLLTALCPSRNKYSWEEVQRQLLEIMGLLSLEISWSECQAYLDSYLDHVSDLLEIKRST
ncbi:MAG: hypothetical protein JW986_01160 [Methanotrichaceae archaeon]|nr:hypothetical protein [Methanotrichaceae archaeon]